MKKRIGELLIEAGACSENDVREALGHQRAWASNRKLGEVLVSVGKVTPTAVARALSAQFDLPFVTLPQIPEKVSKTVPLNYQEENRIVPFRLEVEGKSERLHIAVADPSNLELVDELRFELRKTVRVYVAASDDIAQAIATMKGESLEEIQPIEVSDEDEETPLQIERGAQTGAPGPVPELPDEWSLGPPSATPEPPSAASRKAAPAEDAQRFAAVLDADSDDSWGAALLPGGPAASPSTTNNSAVPTVSAPPTQPPETKPSSPAPAAELQSPPAKAATKSEESAAQEKFEFNEEDLKILEDIERLADGEPAPSGSLKVQPAQMVASLIRLLIKKGVINELEFLDELSRK